ncbi:MAG: hypothetical protein PHZ03_07220 [Syntrophomonas sp.]|nr:hypothetical protein [Syntrophomonas sp.]
MAKRRGKIIEEELSTQPPLVKGGNDFDYCVSLFMDEMEIRNLSYHTMRWHKENLHYVRPF